MVLCGMARILVGKQDADFGRFSFGLFGFVGASSFPGLLRPGLFSGFLRLL
jgi:hypothetical protein